MGSITSRQNIGVEEVDISINHAYRYPPKSGNYFSSHFIMGGERFDTAQPEMYLFGENTDLNFLGSRPAPFPYPAPSASEPSRTLKALVNIRKESLRFVRVPDDSLSLKEPENRSPSNLFNIEFTFDCEVRCAITIMYFCTEEVTSTGLIYTPRDSSMNSETYHYKRGANQQFSQVCHVFDPSKYTEENLLYSFDREVIPIVIYCIAEEGEEPFQSHATIAVVEKHSDGFILKPLKQKLFVDGLCYLLQEIYGIENKNTDSKLAADDDPDDNGAECVICMCDLRDTLILPCRHLCLCNCCADSLRYQANNCPICRAPFRALLQIKALQKTASGAAAGASSTTENGENIPAGYEAVSLIEALNGPSVAPPQQPTAPPYQNMYVQLPQSATDGGIDGSLDDGDIAREYQDNSTSKGPGLEDSMTQTDRPTSIVDTCGEITSKGGATQIRMSVLMAQESSEDSVEGKKEDSVSKKKGKFPEDMPGAIRTEMVSPNEGSEGIVRKKSKKSSIVQSPLSPHATSPTVTVKETSLCTSQLEDAEDLTETLGLLDASQSPKRNRGRCSASRQGLAAAGMESEAKSPTGLGGSFPQQEKERGSSNRIDIEAGNDEEGDCEEMGDFAVALMECLPQSQSSNGLSRSLDEETCSEDRSLSKRSPKKNKDKSNFRGGRKERCSLSSGYGLSSYPEAPVSTTEESSQSLAPESQSLPGTPLSHSSAISRSSDASVSSASSTRALILSNPTHSSSTAI